MPPKGYRYPVQQEVVPDHELVDIILPIDHRRYVLRVQDLENEPYFKVSATIPPLFLVCTDIIV
jgi:hypothetical protein